MKIFITGTNNAIEKNKNQKNVINFNNLLRPILLENGHELVDNVDKSELVICFLLDFRSLNNGNIINCLNILKNYNSIIAFDDWNIKVFYQTLKLFIKGNISKTHPKFKYDDMIKNQELFIDLLNGKYKSIFPAYKTGNHNLLGIIGEKYYIDPSIYIEKKYNDNIFGKDFIPIFAGLANKDNYLKKLDFYFEQIKDKTEDEVFNRYCSSGIVLTVPHYHDGSGWFRNRYSLTNKAKAILINDVNSIFGDSYKIKYKDFSIEKFNDLFEKQNIDYNKTIMSKNEISNNLKLIIK